MALKCWDCRIDVLLSRYNRVLLAIWIGNNSAIQSIKPINNPLLNKSRHTLISVAIILPAGVSIASIEHRDPIIPLPSQRLGVSVILKGEVYHTLSILSLTTLYIIQNRVDKIT